MSGSLYGQHVRSLYMQPSRPIIPRQRSNSLPPGLALMNAEEANIIFSAAERATARRRKMVSVDHTISNTPIEPLDNSRISSIATIKSSPFRQITSIQTSMNKPLPPEPPKANTERASRPVDISWAPNNHIPSTTTLPESIFQSLPHSPLSSPKRLVTSNSLKSYADGLFKFTQSRLTSAIPQIRNDSTEAPSEHTPEKSSEPRELASVVSPQPSRPYLQSRFSDWSVTTGANSESRRTSLGLSVIDLDSELMFPDPFFNSTNEEFKETEFNFNRISGVSFASSETYQPPSTLSPPTPLLDRTPGSDDKEEISYFTNFDVYVAQETPQRDWPLPGEAHVDNVIIDLSPLELPETQQVPPPRVLRDRANTVIRRPARSAPAMQSTVPPHMSCSRTSTPLQIAEVGVRIPHWLIGAIG